MEILTSLSFTPSKKQDSKRRYVCLDGVEVLDKVHSHLIYLQDSELKKSSRLSHGQKTWTQLHNVDYQMTSQWTRISSRKTETSLFSVTIILIEWRRLTGNVALRLALSWIFGNFWKSAFSKTFSADSFFAQFRQFSSGRSQKFRLRWKLKKKII